MLRSQQFTKIDGRTDEQTTRNHYASAPVLGVGIKLFKSFQTVVQEYLNYLSKRFKLGRLVASLELVSPGPATDSVTFFPGKKHTDDLFSHRPLQSDNFFKLSSGHFRRRSSGVLSKFSHNFCFHSGVTPLRTVTRGGLLSPVTPLCVISQEVNS